MNRTRIVFLIIFVLVFIVSFVIFNTAKSSFDSNVQEIADFQITKISGSGRIYFDSQKIKDLSKSQKADLFDFVADKLFTETKIPDWLAEFIEEFMFSIPYEDILDAVQEMKFDTLTRAQTSRNNRILSILRSIKFKKLPLKSSSK